MVYRLMTNLVTQGQLWSIFPGNKIFFHNNGYLARLLSARDEIGNIKGLANRNLFPEFHELVRTSRATIQQHS